MGVFCRLTPVTVTLALAMSPALCFAGSLKTLMLTSGEIPTDCSQIEGEHAKSPQATIEYSVGNAASIHDTTLVDKAFQSFKCGDVKGTIYFYEYHDDEDIKALLDITQRLIWGDSRRSGMHPELIYGIGNVVVVVSGRKPKGLLKKLGYTGDAIGVSTDAGTIRVPMVGILDIAAPL